MLQQAPHPEGQLVQRERFFEVIIRAATESGDGRAEAGIPGHQDHHRPRIEQPRPLEHFETVAARQHEVGDDDVELLRLETPHGVLAVPGRDDLKSLRGQRVVQDLLHLARVVHDQDRCGHDAVSWRTGAGWMERTVIAIAFIAIKFALGGSRREADTDLSAP